MAQQCHSKPKKEKFFWNSEIIENTMNIYRSLREKTIVTFSQTSCKNFIITWVIKMSNWKKIQIVLCLIVSKKKQICGDQILWCIL